MLLNNPSKYVLKVILLSAMVTGCRENSSVCINNNVTISPQLSVLIKKKISEDKFALGNNLKMIYLMHILYDSLGMTQIIITPTNSSSMVKNRMPTFLSKIDDKLILIYNSNDEFLLKDRDYDRQNMTLIDSALSGSEINAKVYMKNMIRIKFVDGNPCLDYLSKTIPPILGLPPKYPPVPIVTE